MRRVQPVPLLRDPRAGHWHHRRGRRGAHRGARSPLPGHPVPVVRGPRTRSASSLPSRRPRSARAGGRGSVTISQPGNNCAHLDPARTGGSTTRRMFAAALPLCAFFRKSRPSDATMRSAARLLLKRTRTTEADPATADPCVPERAVGPGVLGSSIIVASGDREAWRLWRMPAGSQPIGIAGYRAGLPRLPGLSPWCRRGQATIASASARCNGSAWPRMPSRRPPSLSEHAMLAAPDSAGRIGLCPTRALLPRFWGGLSVVSGLGPGLTCSSADAAPGCLVGPRRPGPRFGHPPARPADLPGLCKRPGFHGSDGQQVRAIP